MRQIKPIELAFPPWYFMIFIMNIKYLFKDLNSVFCKRIDTFLQKVFEPMRYTLDSGLSYRRVDIINRRRVNLLNFIRTTLGQFFTYFLVKATEHELSECGGCHNTGCWICPFGWKDADLDEGCCGVGKNNGFTRNTVKFDVGGHATFCAGFDVLQWDDNIGNLDEEDFSRIVEIYDENVQEIMCGIGYPGDWTGDDWCIYFHKDIEVPWERYLGIFRNPVKTAERIIKAAVHHTDEFEKEVVLARKIQHDVTVDFEENYEKILNTYENYI